MRCSQPWTATPLFQDREDACGSIRRKAQWSCDAIAHRQSIIHCSRASRRGCPTAFPWRLTTHGVLFIDGESDIVNPSPTGEIGFPQDSFNRNADRGRSAFDRPHRVAVNGVLELPFLLRQKGALGRILGGWQATGFLTLQSGAPFSVLDGTDPGLRLSGLATTVRANINTVLDVSRMSID